MSRTRPMPRARESAFGLDELFFSITDRRGHIRSGNAVFTRTSGYPTSELIGAPHNLIRLIRHPDVPRVIFRLLWTFLEAERPIATYVTTWPSVTLL